MSAASPPVVILIRHGETTWSRSGQHTGRTDLALTKTGREEARNLGKLLVDTSFDLVLSSPMRRARQTAELAGLTPYEVDSDLREWDYGDFEGLTTDQITQRYPHWTVWGGPWPGGEEPDQVAARADRVVQRVLDLPAGSHAALVAHGHILRVLAARWLRQGVRAGRFFSLATTTLSQLAWEHGDPVVARWNVGPVVSAEAG